MVAMPIAATATTASSAMTVSSVSGGAFVSRNGVIAPLRVGDGLRVGDKVMTRAGSSVGLSSSECARTFGSSSMVTLTGTSCAALAPSADLSQVGAGDDGDGSGAGAGSYVVAFLAAVAVGLGIWAAVDGETDDAPVSA
ncbi:hypothetical protein D1610_14770 [Sphingomonas gilva]|uniref:Uncharacterized protein n=2 Tax=Sphingomonas gilva TaxID=2305907 RepID=A0A396RQU0_9SPHN|nr:hypothetical protein D1610_14770 [Sphingomonas gilva]